MSYFTGRDVAPLQPQRYKKVLTAANFSAKKCFLDVKKLPFSFVTFSLSVRCNVTGGRACGSRRAAMVLLTRYHQDYVLTHVSQIVHRWAPAADGNNEEAYTKFVESQMTGILGTDGFVPASRRALYALVTAMSRMESGYIPLDQELDDAWHKLPAWHRAHWV